MSEWSEALAECDTVTKFNEWALSLARERRGRDRNDEFAFAVAAEARRRCYTWIGDRETGCYADITPEEYQRVIAELERRDKRAMKSRLYKKARATKVQFVHAAWMESSEDIGVMVILDFRKKDRKSASEFEDVPKRVFESLFQKGADLALKNVFKMFTDKLVDVPDYREAG